MAKKRSSNLKAVVIAAAIIVAVFTGGIVYYLSGIGAVDSSDKKDVVVEIPVGSGASSIVAILDDAGLVKNTTCAKINSRIGGYNSLQANTYVFSRSMTFPEMMKAINTGDFDYLSKETFEIKDGYRLQQNAELLSKAVPFSKKEILATWSDKEYLKSLIGKYWFLTDDILNKDVMYPLEGYLFPDTYILTGENPSVESVTEMILDNTDRILTERKDEINKSGYSVHEFLTISSIVCKEGGSNPDEASHIAGVFINRLKENISLGSDVTVCYIFQEDRVDLKKSQLSSDSPYNTRKFTGLPPGPICSVPAVDMDAVLNYEKTDDLFFYAGPDGTVYYAKTDAEHQKNVQAHPWTEEDLSD